MTKSCCFMFEDRGAGEMKLSELSLVCSITLFLAPLCCCLSKGKETAMACAFPTDVSSARQLDEHHHHEKA